jgi:hypothetical protein
MYFWHAYEPFYKSRMFNHLFVHRFDGEAMVHAIHIAGGEAKSYTNHWIRTKRYLYEKAAGFNLYLRVLSPSAVSMIRPRYHPRGIAITGFQPSLAHQNRELLPWERSEILKFSAASYVLKVLRYSLEPELIFAVGRHKGLVWARTDGVALHVQPFAGASQTRQPPLRPSRKHSFAVAQR